VTSLRRRLRRPRARRSPDRVPLQSNCRSNTPEGAFEASRINATRVAAPVVVLIV
jgi:hypothetical protein